MDINLLSPQSSLFTAYHERSALLYCVLLSVMQKQISYLTNVSIIETFPSILSYLLSIHLVQAIPHVLHEGGLLHVGDLCLQPSR